MIRKTGIAAFLLLAVCIVMLRVITAVAPDHLAKVESLLDTVIGRPVRIGTLYASWQGWGPQLLLEDFRLRDEADTRDLVTFTEARIRLDLLATIVQQHLALSLLRLSARDLYLVRAPDGAIGLEGFDPHNSQLAKWLLKQQSVVVHADRVHLRVADSPVAQAEQASDVEVTAKHSGTSNELQLAIVRMPQSGAPLQFSLHYQGDLFSASWAGDGYLKGKKIAGDTLRAISPLNDPIAGRVRHIDAQLRAQWMDAKPIQCSGSIAVEVRTPTTGSVIETVRASGSIAAKRRAPDQWQVDLNDWHVVAPSGSWLLHPIGVSYGVGNHPYAEPTVTVSAKKLPVDALLALHRLRDDATASGDWLIAAHPHGEVRELVWRHELNTTGTPSNTLRSEVRGLGFAPVGNLPGVSGINGHIALEQGRLQADVQFDEATLAYPSQYTSPIALHAGNGLITWSRTGDDWRLDIAQFALGTTDFMAQMVGNLTGNALTGRASIATDLSISVDRIALSRVHAYLPRKLPLKVREWLQRALISGYATQGQGRLQGVLADFPFDNGQGQVNAAAEIHNGKLAFLPDWPALEDVDGKFTYDRRQISVVADSATTRSARLTAVESKISALGTSASQLHVHGVARSSAAIGLRYLAATPMGSGFAQQIEKVAAQGDQEMTLDLTLPFSPAPLQFHGGLRLANTTLTWGPHTLHNVSGRIDFNEAYVRSAGLHGTFRDRPLFVDVDYGLKPMLKQPRGVRLRGKLDADLLTEWLARAVGTDWPRGKGGRKPVLFKGSTAFSAELMQAGLASDRTMSMLLRSDLRGLAIAAPPPLGKATTERLPLTVMLAMAKSKAIRAEVRYGNRAKLDTDVSSAGEMQNLAVTLGKDAAMRPAGADFWLGGQLTQLSITQWRNFLNSMPAMSVMVADVESPRRKLVDLTVQDLELAGHVLRQTHLWVLVGHRSRWQVRVDGPDAIGTVRFYPKSQRLRGRFKRLWLRPLPGRNAEPDLDPRSLPNVELNCLDFKYQDVHLGNLGVSARVDEVGVHFSRLGFSSDAMRMQGEGSWLADGNNSRSDFDIRVEAPAVGGLLGAFGYGNSDIAGGAAQFHISATWPGTPAQFALAKLSGHLRMAIGAGRLLAVQNRVGRIFGLLSINTFWRRLSLDFSDVFRQGFAFDSIEGDFHVHDGDAHTDNLTLTGPAARIEIRGETSLTQQRYDQRAIVTPTVADTLPVAGAFFGPAGIGVGAMVYLAGKLFPALPENIDGMMRSEYSITGHWQDPQVRRVSGF